MATKALRVDFTEAAAPATPAAGDVRLYAKSDGLLYSKDDAGVETLVSVGSAGLGAWTSYTPTWGATTTPPTLGSSTITGRYKALDSKTYIVEVNCAITTGGAWNAGSGGYTFSLPAGVTSSARYQVGSAHVLDNGTAHFAGICKVNPSDTKIAEVVVADASSSRLLGATLPVTWATGDQINLSIIVEVV